MQKNSLIESRRLQRQRAYAFAAPTWATTVPLISWARPESSPAPSAHSRYCALQALSGSAGPPQLAAGGAGYSCLAEREVGALQRLGAYDASGAIDPKGNDAISWNCFREALPPRR
jgi:hypothetical protein